MKLLFIAGIILLLFPLDNVLAQNVVSNSGGHFESPRYQISWTIGEPIIKTCEGGDFCLTQGFHQSMLTVTAINEIPELLVEIKAFPNPVTSIVNLSVNSENIQEWQYALINNEGKLMESKNIISKLTEIPMQSYVASHYILQVKESGRLIKSFKIVKSR